MNKTLLLIIIDFLFLNLIALTRWEKVEPARATPAPVPQVGANAPTSEQDLVATMRQQLADEQSVRLGLGQRLAAENATLSAREQGLSALEAARAQLAGRLADTQRTAAELAREAQSAREASDLSQQQLAQLQRELEERRAEADRQRKELASLQADQNAARKQIEGLTLAVVVGESEKQHLLDQNGQLQSQVQTERAERAKVQESAERLAQGVGQLAENSGELTKEIRENRPINANVLYNEFLANRVGTSFAAERRGLFGPLNRSKDTPTVFVTDGKQVYALLHLDDTVFSATEPNFDWAKLAVTFHRPPAYQTQAGTIRFLAADPRVIVLPVDPLQVAALGVRAYPLAADPFKFPDAVLVDGTKGYGELPFKLDPSQPGYVRVDNRFFRRLFGDFAPARGDLVFSRTGEVLGMMVNSDYCVLVRDFTPIATLRTGNQGPSSQTAQLLNQIAARVQALPFNLQ
jgi:hypothetical protein